MRGSSIAHHFAMTPSACQTAPMVTHVVMWRFNDPADIPEAAARLRALADKVAGVRSLRVGINSNQGPHAFELVLVSEHDSFEDLGAYVADPEHQEVAAWLSSRIAERAVVDTDDLS